MPNCVLYSQLDICLLVLYYLLTGQTVPRSRFLLLTNKLERASSGILMYAHYTLYNTHLTLHAALWKQTTAHCIRVSKYCVPNDVHPHKKSDFTQYFEFIGTNRKYYYGYFFFLPVFNVFKHLMLTSFFCIFLGKLFKKGKIQSKF